MDEADSSVLNPNSSEAADGRQDVAVDTHERQQQMEHLKGELANAEASLQAKDDELKKRITQVLR